MRNPRQREADLRAQLAANRAGGERVAALVERFGIDAVRAGHGETLDYAERRTRARIAELDDGDARGARRARGRASGDLELRAARDGARRRADARLLRLAPPSTTAT